MASLVGHRRWGLRKPALGSRVDWGHPLAEGLLSCWLLNEGYGSILQDIAGAQDATLNTGSPIWQPTAGGMAPTTTAGQYFAVRNPSVYGVPVATGMTICLVASVNASVGTQNGFQARAVGGSTLPILGLSSTYNSINFITWGSVLDQLVLDPAPDHNDQGRSEQILATTNGAITSKKMYYNGVFAIGSTPLTNTIAGAGFATAGIGGNATDGAFVGRQSPVYVWRRELSAADAAWLAAEPYAFIIPPGPSISRFFLAGSAAPAAGGAGFRPDRSQRGSGQAINMNRDTDRNHRRTYRPSS